MFTVLARIIQHALTHICYAILAVVIVLVVVVFPVCPLAKEREREYTYIYIYPFPEAEVQYIVVAVVGVYVCVSVCSSSKWAFPGTLWPNEAFAHIEGSCIFPQLRMDQRTQAYARRRHRRRTRAMGAIRARLAGYFSVPLLLPGIWVKKSQKALLVHTARRNRPLFLTCGDFRPIK